MNEDCRICGVTRQQRDGQWWHLRNYYGWTGLFCPDCHNKVSHDSYGNPNNPQEYTLMLLQCNRHFD